MHIYRFKDVFYAFLVKTAIKKPYAKAKYTIINQVIIAYIMAFNKGESNNFNKKLDEF